LKSIGPNIVFALLMDGPQISERWSGRYALTLTEDPGSSVLTMTSMALIERSNFNRPGGSRSIALWRDDTGRAVSLECPKGALGVLLTLSGHRLDELTIDGRQNRDAYAWRYSGHRPISLRNPDEETRTLIRWADPYNN
ncbi:MAG: hypothetical protein B7Z26_09900, partial [Asticcacaulis sp. 32-58-5]